MGTQEWNILWRDFDKVGPPSMLYNWKCTEIIYICVLDSMTDIDHGISVTSMWQCYAVAVWHDTY